METIRAVEYALGIYGVSLLVTLFVWFVIVVIRWASSERVHLHQKARRTR